MTEALVEDAHRFLRAENTTADIQFGEHFRDLKYVVAPDGRLLAPAMVAMLQTIDAVLFVPEVREGAMELQVTLEQFDEHGPDGQLADRWRIHHGEPPDVNWAFLELDAARYGEMVIDGDALVRRNPLAGDEPRLCREMNERQADLRQLCLHFARMGVQSPVMVAIDPMGLDVRGRFDVIRVPAPEEMTDAASARRVIEKMCVEAREQVQAE